MEGDQVWCLHQELQVVKQVSGSIHVSLSGVITQIHQTVPPTAPQVFDSYLRRMMPRTSCTVLHNASLKALCTGLGNDT